MNNKMLVASLLLTALVGAACAQDAGRQNGTLHLLSGISYELPSRAPAKGVMSYEAGVGYYYGLGGGVNLYQTERSMISGRAGFWGGGTSVAVGYNWTGRLSDTARWRAGVGGVYTQSQYLGTAHALLPYIELSIGLKM